MDIVFWLIVISVIVHGIIAGLSFDVALVKLPTRKRIGAIAYAHFARGNDLGNGVIVYPIVGIVALAGVLGMVAAAIINKAPSEVMTPVLAALVGTLLHTLCTAKAAPIMISLKHTPDDEKILAAKLDSFAGWHALRAIFQFLTFVVLVWALVGAARIV